MSRTTDLLAAALDAARAVPPMTTFPGVDELHESFRALAASRPGIVSVSTIGRSRLGEPIDAYRIGSGGRDIVVAGGVHPNEPIGFRTAQQLARLLLADDHLRARLDATWHIVPCADPDGTRLNESWFSAPSDRAAYFRGFYRPAPTEQVEWSFPFRHKTAVFDDPIPETRALMALFDATRPALFTGLHNAELGGVYFYVSRELPGLVDALHAIPAGLGLPLDIGEPESPELTRLGAAVFRAPLARERYDYLESLGVDPGAEAGGAGSADYLEPHGTLTLVAELPYWTHPDAADPRLSAERYGDVVARKAARLRDLHDELSGILDEAGPHLRIDDQLARATRTFVPMMGALADAEDARLAEAGMDRAATVAEVFGNREMVRMFRLRFGGMLRRTLEAEVRTGTAAEPVRRAHADLEERFARWCDPADDPAGLSAAPIERLVGVQLASILATAALLQEGPR